MRRHGVAVLISFAYMSFASPAGAATITFDSKMVSPDLLSVDIRIENVDFLYGFDFTLGFDTTKVSFISAQEGPFLIDEDPSDPTTPPNVTSFLSIPSGTPTDQVRILNTILGPSLFGFSGSGVLAVLTFLPVGNGDAALTFSGLDFANAIPGCDEPEAEIPCLSPIDIEVDPDARLIVEATTPVPEPASLTLFGLGLLGLARRFR